MTSMGKRLRAARLLGVVSLAGLTACAEDLPGSSPPSDQLHFPVSMLLVPGATPSDDHLVVCNGNFDQRYNAGSLMTLPLETLFSQALAADIQNPSPTLPVSSFLRVRSLCGELSFQASAPGSGRLFFASRLDRSVSMVRYQGVGVLGCSGAGAPLLGTDCTEGHSVGLESSDPFAVASTPPLPGLTEGLVVVGLFGDRTKAAELVQLDGLRIDDRADRDPTVDPVITRSSSGLDGVSSLLYLPPPALGSTQGVLLAAALIAPADRGVPISSYRIVATEDGFSLGARRDADSFGARDLIATRGMVPSADLRRLYATFRIEESSPERAGAIRFNAAVGVMSLEGSSMKLLSLFEVGEELGPPALLERGGRRLLYVPDHRTGRLWVLDVTRDAPAVVSVVLPRGERVAPEGALVPSKLLATPTAIVFAERNGRTLGFITNFGNSTLAVIDVTSEDPQEHAVIARFGEDKDPTLGPEVAE